MYKRFFYILSYLSRPPWDTGISPPELTEFIRAHPAGRALDIGCGTGTNAITLAQHGWEVTAVDFVGKAVRSARGKAERAGVDVNFQVRDVAQLEESIGKFDLILDIGCFHSLTESGKKAYTSNLASFLTIEGTFLIYGFLKQNDQSGTGIDDEDMVAFERNLELISRRIGTDRGRRSSVWLEFKPLSVSIPHQPRKP